MMGNRRIRWTIGESSHNESNRSATEVASNNDLLLEILFRLPIRSLLVFKSVAKRWLSLISDPYFAHNHYLRNYPSLSGIFLCKSLPIIHPEFEFIPLNNKASKAPFKSLKFTNDRAGITIQQYCNGLFCCRSLLANSNNRNYYIYNPCTKHYTILPRPHGLTRRTTNTTSTICSVSLAFDPLMSPHYKVVCIWRIDNSSDNYQIEIYHSKTASWKLCRDVFTACDYLLTKSGVFWNGALHWIICGESSLCLDVNKELLSTMPMRNLPHDQAEVRVEYFGASRYHVHLIERYDGNKQFQYLEMKTDYSGWNLKYRINLDVVTIASPEIIEDYVDDEDRNHYPFSVLLVQEEEKSASMILHIPGEIISYNLKDNTFEQLKYLSPGLGEYCHYLQYQRSDSFEYIESLACV